MNMDVVASGIGLEAAAVGRVTPRAPLPWSPPPLFGGFTEASRAGAGSTRFDIETVGRTPLGTSSGQYSAGFWLRGWGWDYRP
jgi:hypothetical protein